MIIAIYLGSICCMKVLTAPSLVGVGECNPPIPTTLKIHVSQVLRDPYSLKIILPKTYVDCNT